MHSDAGIGARIKALRGARGWTQQQLADRAHLSYATVHAAEAAPEATYFRPVTSGTLHAVAAALGVSPNRLTGQPYYGDDPAAGPHGLIESLAGELLTHDVPIAVDTPPVPLPELTASVAAVQAARHRADIATAIGLLPAALAAANVAWQQAAPASERRRQVAGLRWQTYDALASASYALGYRSLATAAAARMAAAAADTDDPVLVALGRGLVASYLARCGRPADGYRVTTAAVDALGTPSSEPAWAVWGFLQLQAGLDSARVGDGERAWEHHSHAAAAATRSGPELANHYHRWFSPTNVGIWGVAIGLDALDDARAVHFADTTRIYPGFPAARVGQHWIDTARARLFAGRPGQATTALQTARTVAPGLVRTHPMFREALVALAGAERRSTGTVRELANWAGIPD
jgi:transcriptional regulator with XRE-family HTH domain